jgi:hypothetical protein
MRFMAKGDGMQEFYTFILPVDRSTAPPEVSEVPMVNGRAFVIKYSGYTDVFVYSDNPGEMIDTGIFETNFKYSWARMSEGESVPDEIVLVDGDRLAIGGKEMLDIPALNYASVRRLGTELYIHSNTGRSTRSLT